MQGLKLVDEQQGGIWFVTARGYLDASTAEDLDKLILAIIRQGCYRIVLDLGGIDFMSSAGAGVLMAAHKQAEGGRGGIAFVRPSDPVRSVFKMLGLLDIFTVVDSRDEAVAALPRR